MESGYQQSTRHSIPCSCAAWASVRIGADADEKANGAACVRRETGKPRRMRAAAAAGIPESKQQERRRTENLSRIAFFRIPIIRVGCTLIRTLRDAFNEFWKPILRKGNRIPQASILIIENFSRLNTMVIL